MTSQRGAMEMLQKRIGSALLDMGSKSARLDSLIPASVRFRGGLPRAVKHPNTGRYLNPWLDPTTGQDPCEKTFQDTLKMIRQGRTMPTDGPSPVEVQWDVLREAVRSGATTATWLGHACTLVTVRGSIFLIDPIFSDRCSPFSFAGPKRFVPSPVNVDDWPDDLAPRCVLLTHGHYDHLCLPTLSALNERFGCIDIIAPLGHRKTLEDGKLRFDKIWTNGEQNDTAKVDAESNKLTELDWWGSRTVSGTNGLSIMSIPAQHWTSRYGWDRNKALWCGFSILASHDEPSDKIAENVIHEPCENMRDESKSISHPLGVAKFVHAGDTGYCEALSVVRRHLGGPRPEIAAIPIGAYQPRWFMLPQHCDPAQAIQMHRDLESDVSFAVHWGTFPLTSETTQTQLGELNTARQAAGSSTDEFVAIRSGTTLAADSSSNVRAEIDIASQIETLQGLQSTQL